MTAEEAPAAKAGSYRFTRTNYLVDSRFQLKYTGLIVLVTVFVSAGLFTFLWKTSAAVVRESRVAAEQSSRAVAEGRRALSESKKASEHMTMSLINNPVHMDNPKFLQQAIEDARKQDEVIRDQVLALTKQQDALAPQLAAVARRQSQMLIGLGGALALLIIVIGVLGVYFTHRVAGPIYKMKQLLRQVGEGKLVFEARLRKGDELQDFFEAFSSMVDRLHGRQVKAFGALERAIETARAGGADGDEIARITSVHDEVKRALSE